MEDAPDEYYSVGPKLAENPMDDGSLRPIQPSTTVDVPSLVPPTDPLETVLSHPPVSPLDLHPSSPPNKEGYFPSVPLTQGSISTGLPATKTSPSSIAPLPTNHDYHPLSPPCAQGTPPIVPQPTLYQPLQPQIPSPVTFQHHSSAPISGRSSSQISFQTPQVYRDAGTSQAYNAPSNQLRKPISPEDIAKAQKFAKWAISALDYDDIDNAIEQFRSGLAALGVS